MRVCAICRRDREAAELQESRIVCADRVSCYRALGRYRWGLVLGRKRDGSPRFVR